MGPSGRAVCETQGITAKSSDLPPISQLQEPTAEAQVECLMKEQTSSLTVIVQNLQKYEGLAGRIVEGHAPDILLAQELSLYSEETGLFRAHHTSFRGYGTGIHCRAGGVAHVKHVESPVAELGGFIVKKTTVAECAGIQCVSFHGYNGTPFRRNVRSLVLHVQAVLEVLGSGPAIFAGDFNSWTAAHLHSVSEALGAAGFHKAFSWPYPGRDHPLDHAFLRGLKLLEHSTFKTESDHLGAKLIVERV